MAFKLKTSSDTKNIFESIQKNTGLQPYVLVKLCLALSIKSTKELTTKDFNTPNDGLELNRQTISGDYDKLFSSLIVLKSNKALSESEVFPKYFKAHIDRGAKLLEAEYKYSPGSFYSHLCSIEKGI